MKLEIVGQAYAQAEINLVDFKKDMTKDFNIEKAIFDNTSIIRNDSSGIDINSLKKLIYGSLDWFGLIDRMSEKHKDSMRVNFYLVKYSDWKKMYPKERTADGREVELIDSPIDGMDTLLIQSLVPNTNFDIKAFIKRGCFTYVSTDKIKTGWVIR